MASHPHSRQGHLALRRGRHSTAGQIYLVTTTTARHVTPFLEPRVAFAACRELAALSTWMDARLLCWVLMPDHFHGLVELGERHSLPGVINRFKSVTALATNKALATMGPVWSRGYHDRAIRKEETIIDVARYVVMNPVRAGIVGRVWDYSYWDAIWV